MSHQANELQLKKPNVGGMFGDLLDCSLDNTINYRIVGFIDYYDK